MTQMEEQQPGLDVAGHVDALVPALVQSQTAAANSSPTATKTNAATTSTSSPSAKSHLLQHYYALTSPPENKGEQQQDQRPLSQREINTPPKTSLSSSSSRYPGDPPSALSHQQQPSLTHVVRPSPNSPNPASPSDPVHLQDDHNNNHNHNRRAPASLFSSSTSTTHRAYNQTSANPTLSAVTTDSPLQKSPRFRASTFDTSPATSSAPAPASIDTDSSATRRPSSFPVSPSSRSAYRDREGSAFQSRSDPSIDGSDHFAAPDQDVLSPLSSDFGPAQRSQGQRELLLPKSVANSSPPDDRRASLSRRPPPVSYKAPINPSPTHSGASTPVRVPPIRSFRSSGSRKSLVLDMNQLHNYDLGDDPLGGNRDSTLRALEGRRGTDSLPMTPPTSARADGLAVDDSGDVFMKIAREEPRRPAQDPSTEEAYTQIYRTIRPSHRRPQSTAVASYTPTSPPQLARRLSDQQDSVRPRRLDDERASEVSRVSAYRSQARDRPPPSYVGDGSRSGYVSRASPSTPRSTHLQDAGYDGYNRRRPSVTESGSTLQRTSSYRTSVAVNGNSKSYHSSPLVRAHDGQNHHGEAHNAVEGTESTASTTAPSTVWDHLDDIRTRIHRLELTGKLPSTSGAAVSRTSDDRPPTATTTVTTMSSSPKRSGGSAAAVAQAGETISTTSSQRETHPVLLSALSKSKPFLNTEVFKALETAANDAMGLSAMMGTVGQPGPISSCASTMGPGAAITDRQLRRKADSVCRSLTELCVALGEDVTQNTKTAPPVSYHPGPRKGEAPTTPTVHKSTGGYHSRRSSMAAEPSQPPVSGPTSPRTVSKFEERRQNLLNGSSLPSPRGADSNPPTPHDTASNRRSSLLISRTRRAGTEEPEDGRASSFLRNRRAGTEEPDEGRKTSLLVRHRRGTADGEEDETRYRTPSRANTEVHSSRGPAREYIAHQQQPQPQASIEAPAQPASALPRRRFASTNLNTTRLVTPAVSTGGTTRRYLERSAPEQDHGAALNEQPLEDKRQRHLSLGPSVSIHRTGSLNGRRPPRDSTVSGLPSSTGVGYR